MSWGRRDESKHCTRPRRRTCLGHTHCNGRQLYWHYLRPRDRFAAQLFISVLLRLERPYVPVLKWHRCHAQHVPESHVARSLRMPCAVLRLAERYVLQRHCS